MGPPRPPEAFGCTWACQVHTDSAVPCLSTGGYCHELDPPQVRFWVVGWRLAGAGPGPGGWRRDPPTAHSNTGPEAVLMGLTPIRTTGGQAPGPARQLLTSASRSGPEELDPEEPLAKNWAEGPTTPIGSKGGGASLRTPEKQWSLHGLAVGGCAGGGPLGE